MSVKSSEICSMGLIGNPHQVKRHVHRQQSLERLRLECAFSALPQLLSDGVCLLAPNVQAL